ncbi:MAG: sugar transferase [Candidatus Paceibacterota bacterium]|jgi:exopolysaccharide biosynthesis polyprenyl glycosylphosphotransferase
MPIRIKQILLIAGDIILLYGCLFLTLLLRYGDINRFLGDHLGPFSVVFVLWLISFYIVGLYDIKELKFGYNIAQNVFLAVLVGMILAIVTFYLVPYFYISPKTNLVIFSFLFMVVTFAWRWIFSFISKTPQRKTLIIGTGPEISELTEFLIKNPQMGYEISYQIKDPDKYNDLEIKKIIGENQINKIIFVPHLVNKNIIETIYDKISQGLEITDSATAYEELFKKTPIEESQKIFLMTQISKSRKIYQAIKRPLEFLISLVLAIVLLPLMVIIFVLIKITSRGPGIYKQVRVGKNQKNFIIYKFRTMTDEKDQKIIAIGKVLRFTHLDEIPQLLNIIKGDISFVGPRPEQLGFVKEFEKQIPYYNLRHLIKPGLTGWAQVNYRYGLSVEETRNKMQYDIYYIKNRSLTLDLLIILRTIKMVFFNY